MRGSAPKLLLTVSEAALLLQDFEDTVTAAFGRHVGDADGIDLRRTIARRAPTRIASTVGRKDLSRVRVMAAPSIFFVTPFS